MKTPKVPKEPIDAFVELSVSTEEATNTMVNRYETVKSVKARYHWLIYWLFYLGILKEKG